MRKIILGLFLIGNLSFAYQCKGVLGDVNYMLEKSEEMKILSYDALMKKDKKKASELLKKNKEIRLVVRHLICDHKDVLSTEQIISLLQADDICVVVENEINKIDKK